jgi:Mg-chelatase subunit ChlI
VAFAVTLAHELQTQGHRADITMLKGARAHAALLEKDEADREDLAMAAQLALPHRMAASPLDSPEKLQEKIALAIREMSGEATEAEPPPDARPVQDLDEMAEQMQVPGSAAAGSIVLSYIKKKTVKPSMTPTASSASPTSVSKI